MFRSNSENECYNAIQRQADETLHDKIENYKFRKFYEKFFNF